MRFLKMLCNAIYQNFNVLPLIHWQSRNKIRSILIVLNYIFTVFPLFSEEELVPL